MRFSIPNWAIYSALLLALTAAFVASGGAGAVGGLLAGAGGAPQTAAAVAVAGVGLATAGSAVAGEEAQSTPGSAVPGGGAQSSGVPSTIPNVAGTWRPVGWKETKTITQSGNEMHWTFTYPWLVLPRVEQATGTVTGNCAEGSARLVVDIDYTYPDGRQPPHKGRYSGELTCDDAGKVVRIRYNNNFVEDRVQ